jgi:hypothetical protein
MKKRGAGLTVVLFSLLAIGIGNPYENFGAMIEPGTTVTEVDSVKLLSPDRTFLTPGWGSRTPVDTFVFTVGFPPWPETMRLYGTVNGINVNQRIQRPELDTRYRFGPGVVAPPFWFAAVPGYPSPGVVESKPEVKRLPRLTVSPSVVTGQMAVALRPVGTGRQEVEIHDAVGNVVRSLDCAAEADGAASATWNREDYRGCLVPEGVYFCRYAASDVVTVRKVVVAH